MMLKKLLLAASLLFCLNATTSAQDLLMTRSPLDFPEAMLALQTSIREHGYTVSRVQRVDIGLTRSGYKTDKYRIVFFGKESEINNILERHPQFVSFLPMNIAIFAEQDNTVLTAINPVHLAKDFPYPDLITQFQRWENDLRSIFDDVKNAE